MRRSEHIVRRLLEAEGQPGDEAEKCLPVPPEEAEVNHFKWPPIVSRSHTSFRYSDGEKVRPPDEHFEFDIPAPKMNPVKPVQQGLALESACNLVDNLLDEPGETDLSAYLNNVRPMHVRKNWYCPNCEQVCSEAEQEKYKCARNQCPTCLHRPVYRVGRVAENEEPSPDDPLDTRSEVDRLLPTNQARLRGNSMIHAPGVINLAQMRWRERSKAAKKNGMDIIKAWQGLPEERYLRILNNDRITIDTEGDDAIITFRDY